MTNECLGPQEGRTALMWAARNGHEEVYKALIANGADVKAKEVRSRNSVSTSGANDQRMFVTRLPELGAKGPVEVHICLLTNQDLCIK
jgi:ankyrin repeat protein